MRGLIATIVLAAALRAENISGNIVINRKLTRRSVTPSVSLYQRGAMVELGKDSPSNQSESDPLAFERTRVAIWIEGEGTPAPVRAVLEQAGRRFDPDLVVVPVGSTVSFPNLDPIFHNVFSLSKAKPFDLGNYSKGQTRYVTFAKAGIVYVNCHLHPNMAATIVVTPNEWCAKADRAGRFELRDLAPGQYTVVAWHKSAGFFRKTVRISPGQDARVEFVIPLSGGER
ncbi:MAG TPA: carboxypeptidase regulatory-like domain-containing protein [Bryobacteraceae bacterium]|nr:carboxypeptidase regulatory-like domain-containing protein [Bryobacteraceae bacterium]